MIGNRLCRSVSFVASTLIMIARRVPLAAALSRHCEHRTRALASEAPRQWHPGSCNLVALIVAAILFAATSSAHETPAPTGPNIEPVDFAATSVAQTDPAAAPAGGVWGFVVFSPDGKLVSTVSVPVGDGPKGEVFVWNVADAKPICHFEQPGRIQAIVFSPDSSLIAIGPDGPQAGVKLIDTATGELKQTLTGPAARTNCLAWSADGKQLALGSTFDKTVRVWDVEKKKFVKAHEVELGTIMAVAFAKEGGGTGGGDTRARPRCTRGPRCHDGQAGADAQGTQGDSRSGPFLDRCDDPCFGRL